MAKSYYLARPLKVGDSASIFSSALLIQPTSSPGPGQLMQHQRVAEAKSNFSKPAPTEITKSTSLSSSTRGSLATPP